MTRLPTEVLAPPPESEPQTFARFGSPWALVVALGLGVFIGGFDQTFVVPVLSSILRDFSVPIDQLGQASWIINGYLLGYTVAMPVMGRLADIHGHLRVFVAGIVIFMVGSVLVALAPNLPTMAAARALTALGGGALVPVALAIVGDVVPPRARPVGLSSISVLDDASSLLGPLWGTLIGVWLGWRGLFWLNLVLAAPVLIAVVLLGRGRRARAGTSADLPGGLLLAAALAALTFALSGELPGPSPFLLAPGLYLVAGVLAALFIRRELGAPAPLVDLRMFRDRRLAVAYLAFLLEGGALITALVNIPLMSEVQWGRTGSAPGLMLMRMVLFMIVGGFVGAMLIPRLGLRRTVTAGFLLCVAGLLGMRAWPEIPGNAAIWPVLALTGLGFTLPDAPLYVIVVEGVELARRASALALLQVAQTMGMIFGMALLASQGLGRFDARAASLFAANPTGTTTDAYRHIAHTTFNETFVAAAIAMAVAAALAQWLPHRRGADR